MTRPSFAERLPLVSLGRPANGAKWTGLAIGALLALLFLVYVVLVRQTVLSEYLSSLVMNIYSNTAALTAGLLAWLGASRAQGRPRVAWRFLSAGILAWGAGDVAWTIYGLYGVEPPPYPGIPDIGYFGLPALAIVGLVKLMRGDTWQQRVRRALGTAAVFLAALMLVWHYIMLPLFRDAGAPLLEKIVSCAYPATDLVLLSAALTALWDHRASPGRWTLLPVALGISAVVSGDIIYIGLALYEDFYQGHFVDYLWMLGLLMLVGGTAFQAVVHPPYGLSPTSARLPNPLRLAGPLALAPAGVALVGILAITGRLENDIVLIILVVCLGLVTTVEPALALFENTRLNRELLRAKEGAEAANRAKTQFLSRTSHELRTPMTSVLGFGALLELDELTPDQRESVGFIMSSGRHLLHLIDELLDVSRIESGRVEVGNDLLAPAPLIAEVMDMTKPLSTDGRIDLTCQPIPEEIRIYGDRQRLKQVLINLVSNAIKYNHAGGSVTIRCEVVTAGRAAIRVTDTGPGIPGNDLGRLFSPFDRLGAEGGPVKGTGLGLALSRALAEAMGGELTVESEVGRGSTFSVVLPAKDDSVPAHSTTKNVD